MKVSKAWLQKLVDLKVSVKEVERLLPLRTIAIKEITEDFIELDMKGYNRADLLSMRGVAYEVAAITDSTIEFKEESNSDFFWVKETLPKLTVNVDDPDLSPLYCLVKIEGLSVQASSKDLSEKLTDSGVRTVNNIADITNLIMLEYGQPLHSFDADQVKGDIRVRVAKRGEKITTLDGKVRDLAETDLLIADEQKGIGIAGVMGGQNTEITNSTKSILLEAAIFEPKNLRKTAQRLNLTSEASKRFQHGLTRKRLLQALNAAIKMYQNLGGKVTAISITGDSEDQLKKVPLTKKKTYTLIGVDISEEDIERYLKKLNFEFNKVDGNWVVTPAFYRLDVEIEEDLIEEVARMYGYENIPSRKLEGELPEKIDQSLFEKIYDTKKTLADLGLTEIQTYSFYSTKVLGALGFNESNQNAIIRIANPISSETEYLREFIWPNLIEVVEKNIKQGCEDIAIFEIGKVYLPQKDQLPKESYRLAITLMNGEDNPIEELLVITKQLSNVIARSKATKQSSSDSNNTLSDNPTKIASPSVRNDELIIEKGGLMKELEALFHPKRFATVKSSDKVIGGVAEVHPRFLNNFGIEKRVAILEISLTY
jgi:phenylalanyl-tRNA synthetase beta chain